MKHSSYKVLNSCTNCKFLLEIWDYEATEKYYCAFNAPFPRPESGSSGMEESWMSTYHHVTGRRMLDDMVKDGELKGTNWDDAGAWEIAKKNWEEWSEGRDVQLSGVCDLWAGEGAVTIMLPE